MMQRLFVGMLLLFSVVFTATPAYAALTNDQVNAVLGLLRSFGAEESIVVNVERALRQSQQCPSLTVSLYRGSTDEVTGGQVSELQQYLEVEPVSGYFGPITEAAVQTFQRGNGIVSSGTPETTGYGVVGPLTRAKILEVCEAAQQSAAQTSQTTQVTEPSSTTQPESTTQPSEITPTAPPSSTPTAFDPDSQEFRDLVYQEGVSTGLSSAELEQLNELLSSIATNDAITIEEAENQSSSDAGSEAAIALIQPLVQSALTKTISDIAGASCNMPGKDFGTPRVMIIDQATCNCSGTTVVNMQPIGPYNVKRLTYYQGSQQCEAFNIPVVGQKLLGTFSKSPICWQSTGNGCRKVKEGLDGHITPGTGSSQQ